MEYTNNLLKQIIALQEENEQLKLRLSGVVKPLNADFKIGDAIISRNRKGIILNIYKDNTAHIETYEGENTYRGGSNLNDLKHQ